MIGRGQRENDREMIDGVFLIVFLLFALRYIFKVVFYGEINKNDQ